ncbi:MAG: hypothetical protein JW720_12965 [Sedimentisphaerales bacterium]|nr:hypothetical protein [Sedimentisphaerales bacterium]
MVAGKIAQTEETYHGAGERVADRVGFAIRCIAVGLLGLYAWTVAVDTDAASLGWVDVVGAGVAGFVVLAFQVCFASPLVFRPLILLGILGKSDHPWISADQRKLAEHGAKRLLLELSVQRLRRRISPDCEVRSVQKMLDRRCVLGGLLYCSSYVLLFVASLVMCPEAQIEESDLVTHVGLLGIMGLIVSVVCDYALIRTDLWAATTYPQGKTAKEKAPKRGAKTPSPRKKTKQR